MDPMTPQGYKRLLSMSYPSNKSTFRANDIIKAYSDLMLIQNNQPNDTEFFMDRCYYYNMFTDIGRKGGDYRENIEIEDLLECLPIIMGKVRYDNQGAQLAVLFHAIRYSVCRPKE